MRYGGSCARSYAVSLHMAAHERRGLRPSAGDVSTLTVVERDGKGHRGRSAAGARGWRSMTRAMSAAHSVPCENGKPWPECAKAGTRASDVKALRAHLAD